MAIFRYLRTLCVLASLSVIGASALASPIRFAHGALHVPRARQGARPRVIDPAHKARLVATYGQLSLAFEANRGQTGQPVRFLARGAGYLLFLTASGATLELNSRRHGAAARTDNTAPTQLDHVTLRMRFIGANPNSRITGLGLLPNRSNYFIGANSRTWLSNVPTYARVAYQDLYRGVNLIYYGAQGRLEYDLVLAPRTSPRTIRLEIAGARSLHLDARGALVLRTAAGDIRMAAPIAYQTVGSTRRPIHSHYKLMGRREIGFALSAYDTSKPIIIDPSLGYASYLGGSSLDMGTGIAVESSGNAYVVGTTFSADFPTTTGAYTRTLGGLSDVFVTKLNSTGSAAVFSTYLGGSSTDLGAAIAIDSASNVYVTGSTMGNFPVTTGAYSTTAAGRVDAFVTKLNSTGSALVYSTYLGGKNADEGRGIAMGGACGCNAFVTGQTTSTDFPTVSAVQPTYGGKIDAFVVEFSANGSSLLYSSYLGGSGTDIGNGIDASPLGAAYVTGSTTSTDFPIFNAYQGANGGGTDAFLTKFNGGGVSLAFSTYLGGSNTDIGMSVAISGGIPAVAGQTASANFPVLNAAQSVGGGGTDAFVTKFVAGGNSLVFSTYLGGSSTDGATGVALDGASNVYVTGTTASNNFPIVNAVQATYGGENDVFVTKVPAAGGPLTYSTYLGGSSGDNGFSIAAHANSAYITGQTLSTNFPTTSGVFQPAYDGLADAFAARIDS